MTYTAKRVSTNTYDIYCDNQLLAQSIRAIKVCFPNQIKSADQAENIIIGKMEITVSLEGKIIPSIPVCHS